jgi:hypothetical protein
LALFLVATIAGGCSAASSGARGSGHDGGSDGGGRPDAGHLDEHDAGHAPDAGHHDHADAEDDAAPPRACSSTADCSADEICGFSPSVTCGGGGKGQCFPAPTAHCKAYSPGCACGGETINVACTGLPSGYAPQPLFGGGACPARVDAGASCQTSADCGAMEVCGFFELAPCGTPGQCFTIPPMMGECPGGACGCASQEACTCAGTSASVGVTCTNLPAGYLTTPITHFGGC